MDSESGRVKRAAVCPAENEIRFGMKSRRPLAVASWNFKASFDSLISAATQPLVRAGVNGLTVLI
jgi:hypothetical protein